MFIGGDFNRALHQDFDRSRAVSAAKHDSPGMRRWQRDRGLLDVLHAEIDAIAEATHDAGRSNATHRHLTYFYQDESGNAASSRLDRWLTSDAAAAWVRHVGVEVPAPPTGH